MQEKKDKNKNSWFYQFKKSITKLEDYEDFMTDSLWKTIKYFLILVLIFSAIVYGVYIYKFQISDEEGINFFKKSILNLNYETEEMKLLNVDNVIAQNKYNVIIPVWIFILYFTTYFIDAVVLAAIGYLIALIYRIKMRYKYLFNIATHCLTLPIVLNIIYFVVRGLTGFEIKYFQWMYTSISYIYMIVAILMIKTDLIKKQLELTKLQEEQQKIREKLNQEREKNKEEQNDENKKQDKEDKTGDKDETADKQENNDETPEAT